MRLPVKPRPERDIAYADFVPSGEAQDETQNETTVAARFASTRPRARADQARPRDASRFSAEPALNQSTCYSESVCFAANVSIAPSV